VTNPSVADALVAYGTSATRAQALIALGREVRRAFPRVPKGGLDQAAKQLLLAIWLEPGRTVGALAEQLELRPASVSNALAALRAAGLVVDERVGDGRYRLLHTTKAGAALARRIAKDAPLSSAAERALAALAPR
jgi:DNA-binding MarR family transcriptional regulator